MKKKQVLAFSNSIFPLTFLVWAIMLCFPENAVGQNPTIITTPSSGTFTVPAGVTSITVEVWGGGGKGGSRLNSGEGGGGGGGAYSRSVLIVTPGQVLDYYVGFGSLSELPGEDSWFFNNSTVMAKGGNSVLNNGTAGASGGAVALGFGTVKFSGGNGANAVSNNSGGGGSSAGIGANGNNASISIGGTAPIGGGKGGNGLTSGQNRGEDGSSPGGGGGGARRTNASGTEQVGGYGGNGRVRISYIALTSATGTDNQPVCNGDPIINTTYTFPPNSTVTITNLPAGLTSNPNPIAGTISISGTPTASGTYTINVIPSFFFSTIPPISISLTRNGSITVNPKPVINNITNTVCSGNVFTTTPVNGTNGVVPAATTYSWNAPTVTGGLTGGAAVTGASNISGTLTNPTNIAQTATYTVTPITGTCTGPTFTVIVTVNPRPSITNAPVVVCSGDSFTATPANGTNGVVPAGTTYSWPAPTLSAGLTGGAIGSGASSITGTFTNSTNTPQTATYTVTPTSGTCAGTPFTVTVTVSPRPAITNMTGAVCGNDPFTATPTNGTNGVVPAGTTYSWPAPTLSAGLTGGAIGNDANSITGTFTNSTNTSQTATFTVTPTSGSCTGSPFTLTVTVSPRPAITNMTSTICSSDAFTATPVNSTNGVVPAGTTYSWSAPTVTGGLTGGAAGTGVASIAGSLTNPTNTAQTATYTVTPQIGGCTGATFTVTVSVSPRPAIINFSPSICTGSSFTILPTNGTDGIVPAGTTYSWNAPTVTGAITGGVAGSGASSIRGILTNPTNTSQTATYIITPTTGSCVGANYTVTITVDPITAITTQPSTVDDVECFGDGFDPLTVVAQGGDLTYQWYSVGTRVNTGGTAVPGATSNSFTPPSNTTIDIPFYYYVEVTGFCGLEISEVSGEYLVTEPITTIFQNPSSTPQSLCKGLPFSSITVLAKGEGTVTYQWYRNTTDANTGGTLIPGETGSIFNPPSTTVGTLYYYAMASSDCGTVPTDVSGAFTVTPPTSITTENLAMQTICDGETFTPISVVANGTGLIEYQWFSNTTASITGPNVTSIPSANSNTYTPLATAIGTLYYFVEVVSECGTDVISNPSGAFTVNPLPTPTFTSAPAAAVCVGASVTYTTQPGQTNYNWSGFGVAGTDYNITSGGIGSTDNSVTVTWLTSGARNVSVLYRDPNTCTAVVPATNSLTVNPLPTPTFTTAPAAPICVGSSVTYATESGAGQNNYVWSGFGVAGTDYTIISGGIGAGSNSVTVNWLTSGTKNVSVIYTNSNGCTAIVPATNSLTVNPLPVPTFTVVPAPLVCEQSSSTYTTQSGKSNYIWNIPGTLGIDYTITAGGVGTGSSTATIQWMTTGSKTVTVRYTEPTTGCVALTTATSTTTVQAYATVGPPSVAFPSVCISSPTLTSFTRSTTGVTAIANNGITGANGLPPGISANFNSSTGVITFSGTATTTGLFTYNIPLTGNCINGLSATGTIDVTPNYVLTSVSAISATVVGGSARVIINGNPASLPNGEYVVEYILDDGTPPPDQYTSSSFIVSNGSGVFSTVPLTDINVDVYKVIIKSIKKVTDVCQINLNQNDPKNYAFFSVCGATFDQNGTFTVPAGIYEITIQARGAGTSGQTNLITIPVTPGESLGIVIGQGSQTGSARDTYVTRDSSLPNPSTSSLIYATGSGGSGINGTVVISYSCPDPNKEDCIEILDDGAKSGTTVIRFICDFQWQIPRGLIGFSVYAIGGGGGGGMGSTGGGGGGGGYTTTTVNSTNPSGIPAGNNLNITVGLGGFGATTVNIKGGNGGSSMVTATIPDPNGNININMNALGGGGGGSFNNLNGNNGASGGGGAYSDQNTNTMGAGGNGTSGQGRNGGDGGKGNKANHARAGGGGGGAGGEGGVGDGAGVGLSKPGDGGVGISFPISGTTYGYGAGGGGIGFNFNGESDRQGLGGEVGGVILGGTASRDGIGGIGTIYTGSGGGAGRRGGGRGGSGVVYLTYLNFRILPIEFLYFNAIYSPENRSSKLNWATAKEWENSHFEIERSINGANSWTKISEVKGKGYSEIHTEYSFTDSKLPASGGIIYYRLKQVDFDGKFTYSDVKSIKLEALKGKGEWITYPNPSSKKSTVKVDLHNRSTYNDGKILIQISDIRGVAETYTVNQIESVSEIVNTYLERSISGIYILQLIWGDNSQQLKLLRQ